MTRADRQDRFAIRFGVCCVVFATVVQYRQHALWFQLKDPYAATSVREAMQTTSEVHHSRSSHHRGQPCAVRPNSTSTYGTYPLDTRKGSCVRLPNRSVPRAHRRSRGRNLGPHPLIRWRPQRQRLLRFRAGQSRLEDGTVRQGLAHESVHAVAVGEGVRERTVRIYVRRLGVLADTSLLVSA